MVVDTCDTNTEEVEAKDQGFEIIYDCKVSSSLAWDTQKPVSKANKQISKTKKSKVSVASGRHSSQSLPLDREYRQEFMGFL